MAASLLSAAGMAGPECTALLYRSTAATLLSESTIACVCAAKRVLSQHHRTETCPNLAVFLKLLLPNDFLRLLDSLFHQETEKIQRKVIVLWYMFAPRLDGTLRRQARHGVLETGLPR